MTALAAFPRTTGWTSLPRFRHLEQHVRRQDQEWFLLLLEPLTTDEVAERMGPGWTRRQVEHALRQLRDAMPVDVAPDAFVTPRLRIAWLRIAYGIDPCWCEVR